MSNLSYAVTILRKRGIGFFWTYFRESIWFDLTRGTSTAARVPKKEQRIEALQVEKEEGLLYVASFTSVIRNSLAEARHLLGAEGMARAQFFDLGCGKGKALILQAEQAGPDPLHPAVGIEYDPDLADRARANMAQQHLGEDRVQIFADSATNMMTYASAQTLVVYIYNSFQGDTLRTVLGLLQDRPHVLIYVDPVERHILEESSYCIVKSHIGQYNADTWLVAVRNV